jgi:hypothetical protein
VFDGDDDDSGHAEQQGQPLSELIEELLGESVPFQDVLEKAIQEQDPASVADGDERYFNDATLYVELPLYLGEHYERWRNVQNELRHQRRFFSGRAKELFDDLFQNVEHLQGRLGEDADFHPVVTTLPAGAVLFRARAFDSTDALKQMITQPATELGPPPPQRARAGRMNADGVPVFYGALDKETCIAELRPALHGELAVGAFQTARPIRLLDFRLLESAYLGLEPLSYFQSDFNAQLELRAFIGRLHQLIRAPVLPGHESEYLITQAMAEYLAHVREPPFDGLNFESAQRESGANVVLFPANFSNVEGPQNAGPQLLVYQADSLSVHRVRRIEYTSNELHFFEDNVGKLYLRDPYADPDGD